MKLKSFCITKAMATKIEEALHTMGENLCQLYSDKGFNNWNIQGAQKTKFPKSQ
jgi:hypothetical protein